MSGDATDDVWIEICPPDHPDVRGRGPATRLLLELEAHALRRQVQTMRLETNRSLGDAIGLYRRSGYVEVPPFNDKPYAHHWFAKMLARVTCTRHSHALTASKIRSEGPKAGEKWTIVRMFGPT